MQSTKDDRDFLLLDVDLIWEMRKDKIGLLS